MTNISYYVEQTITKTSFLKSNVYKDLILFYKLLLKLRNTVSKKTHYDKLNEWNDLAYEYVHKMLKKYKFINGGKNQNEDAVFWWSIYQIVSGIIWSPNLKTMVANHHSSAHERNEALIKDILVLIRFYVKKDYLNV